MANAGAPLPVGAVMIKFPASSREIIELTSTPSPPRARGSAGAGAVGTGAALGTGAVDPAAGYCDMTQRKK